MNMCPSNKRKTAPELCLKGQVFFIWSNYQSLEIVKDRISLLGGKVDPFLSRDVTTVLVEDNHLVGSQQVTTTNVQVKPTYGSNDAVVATFPYQSSLCNVPSTSRGFNFLAASSSNSPYRVICYALQWGIQVLGIDQFLTWIEPQVKTAITLKKKASESVSKLSGCFIKFESFFKNHRPCYKMFNNDPDRLLPLKNANVLVKAENCNLILNNPITPRPRNINRIDINVGRTIHQAKNVNVPAKVNDKKPQNNKLRPKEENNYCECCRAHFADLKNHIKSVKHQNFVTNEKNYESVHNILKMLPTAQEFIDKLQNPSPIPATVVANGDTPFCMPMANIPDTDSPMTLNMQVHRDNNFDVIMPVDLHVAKDETVPVSPAFHIKKEEENPLPLDLVKRVAEIKTEMPVVKQENVFTGIDCTNSCKKFAIEGCVESKIELKNDDVGVKVHEKQGEIPVDMHCDVNGDPLFDRSTTAALAQLCLKNFDSYWLDTLPCEMDDMVFDDIFDFDDGKTKLDTECPEPPNENFVTSDVAQTPGLVSGISTPSFKTPTNTNMSFCINSPVEMKDIKSESITFPESFPSNCKLEKNIKESFSSQNVASSNETLTDKDNKKKIFSIASYCANKVSPEATTRSCSSKIDLVGPSCSNAVSNNNTELLFSSDSSDNENGSVLISNVLHMINNNSSDSGDTKMTKSNEESSVRTANEQSALPKPNALKKDFEKIVPLPAATETQDIVVSQMLRHPSSEVNNLGYQKCFTSTKINSVEVKNGEEVKNDVTNYPTHFLPLNRSHSVDSRTDFYNYDKSLRRNSSEMRGECWRVEEVPAKKLCSNGTSIDSLNKFSAVNLSSKVDSTHAQHFGIQNITNEAKITKKELGPVNCEVVLGEIQRKIMSKDISPKNICSGSSFFQDIPVSSSNSFTQQILACGASLKELSDSSKLFPSNVTIPGEMPFEILNLAKNMCANETQVLQKHSCPSINVKSKSVEPAVIDNSLIYSENRMNHEFLASSQTYNYNECSVQFKANKIINKSITPPPSSYSSLTNIPKETLALISKNNKVKDLEDRKAYPPNKVCSSSKLPFDIPSLVNSVSSDMKCKEETIVKETKVIPLIPKKAYGKFKKYESEGKSSITIKTLTSSQAKVCEEIPLIPVQPSYKICIDDDQKCKTLLKNISHETNTCEDKTCLVPLKMSPKRDILDTKINTIETSKIAQIENKVCQIKRLHSKDKKSRKTIKVLSSVDKKCVLNEISDLSQSIKPSITDIPDISKNSTENTRIETCAPSLVSAIQPSLNDSVVKLPHKKSSKLQKLPPLWSVSLVPGSGVKLKFTCVQPQTAGTCQSEPPL